MFPDQFLMQPNAFYSYFFINLSTIAFEQGEGRGGRGGEGRGGKERGEKEKTKRDGEGEPVGIHQYFDCSSPQRMTKTRKLVPTPRQLSFQL